MWEFECARGVFEVFWCVHVFSLGKVQVQGQPGPFPISTHFLARKPYSVWWVDLLVNVHHGHPERTRRWSETLQNCTNRFSRLNMCCRGARCNASIWFGGLHVEDSCFALPKRCAGAGVPADSLDGCSRARASKHNPTTPQGCPVPGGVV